MASIPSLARNNRLKDYIDRLDSQSILNQTQDELAVPCASLEEGTIRPDVAIVYALEDAAQAWKDIAEKLPRVHGLSPSGPGAARRRSHGKIVLRVP